MHGRRRHALEQVIDRRDAAVGVAGRAVEAEQVARQLAIDRKAGAGDRARAERAAVGRRERRPQAAGVALELLDHRQQVMGDRRRLRRLRVRQRGEQRLAVAIGQLRSSASRRSNVASTSDEDELPLPQPVHRHVDVVAAARGVQPAGRVLAARLDDQPLDVKEQVLAACRRRASPARRSSRSSRGRRAGRGRPPR